MRLIHGECLEVLRTLPDNSVDSIVTDPPYGLSFMGKKWDYDVPSTEVWAECLRVLKPGGHLLAFAGTRTQHRMAVRIEDAGFEIRDMLAWVYASGFPKSLDVAKAITAKEKTGGSSPRNLRLSRLGDAYRPTGQFDYRKGRAFGAIDGDTKETIHCPAAQAWQGWGTALKPALEPITLARKPLIGTVAANVLAHGTGALNIDGCRIGTDDTRQRCGATTLGVMNDDGWKPDAERIGGSACGRWPANLLHDGSDEVLDAFPSTPPTSQHARPNKKSSRAGSVSMMNNLRESPGKPTDGHKDEGGSAARFFYCPKASKKDRDEGLDHIDPASTGSKGNGLARICETCGASQLKPEQCLCERKSWVNPKRKNNHPTVKPTDLMRYLCRLVTPPGGTVLDPFMGSGSTGKAALAEGFDFVGIEMDADYFEIARARCGQQGSNH